MTEVLNNKIQTAAKKIDDLIVWSRIASKIKNKPTKVLVSSFELVDGYLFKTAIREIIELVPENAYPVVEAWLDAFIEEEYQVLVDATAGFLAELNLIPVIETADEKNVYVAILTAVVRLIPQMTKPAAA